MTMMMRLFLFTLLAMAVAQAARANCGNDKPVGNGCTPGPADPVAAPVVTVTGSQQTTVENALAANGGQGGQGYGGTGTGGYAASSVAFNAPRPAVSMAYAPPIQPTATCAVPLTAGLSFINFGGSFGTAYVDQNCALLEQVRAVAQLGDTETAFEMLCSSKNYAAARERQGRPCRK